MGKAEKCARVISRISTGLGYVSIVLMWGLGALILAEIIVRTALNISLGLTLQLSMWLFIGIVFLGSAYTLHKGGHVKVVIVSVLLPEKAQKWVTVGTSFIAAIVVLWLSWFGLKEAISCYKLEKIGASSVYMPYWPVWIVFFVGLVWLGVQFAGLLIQEVSELMVGEKANEESG